MTAIEVAIGPGAAPGMFRVEVVASPAGEASAAVELDAVSLLARRGLLQQAVLASAVPSRRILPETEHPVREAGQVLFAALLGTGEVAGRYRAAAALAAERGEGLRVVLRIDSPALAGLPWEAMFDQAIGAYVCRRDQLVRHVSVASVPAPLQARLPLRILGVVSSPRGLPPLDVDKEQNQLARALARPASQGLTEVHWAPSATWADLQDLLLDGEWHVLHFIGHGDFDPGRDEGVLALTGENGRADLVAAHRLVDLLRQARPMPRLVVLNSCSGATAGISDLFSGTAAALVRGGVSAVAAMQYEISDPAAVAFARGFYAAVARGRGVDDAISSGRVAILGLSDRTLEWVTPVLYLRGHDTRLFTLPAPAADRSRADIGTEDCTGETGKTAAAPVGVYRGRAIRLLDDAERLARSVTDPYWKIRALMDIAEALAATDPARAAGLIADAQRTAQSIMDKQFKLAALTEVAVAVAATDPARAVWIAQSITDEENRASTLVSVAAAVAVTDPGRAAGLIADAERLAQSITDKQSKELTLLYVVRSLAAMDPDRAERLAQSITDEVRKTEALTAVAKALAVTDPGRAAGLIADAERLAQSIPVEPNEGWNRGMALAAVAEALAAPDPDRAERLAQSITRDIFREQALTAVAGVLAATDPDRAERLVNYWITNERFNAWALARVAGVLAATDPDRAERLAQSMTDEEVRASALADVAKALVATDPDRAERLARAITDASSKSMALACIAKTWLQGR